MSWICAFWSWPAGAAAGCRCRVSLQVSLLGAAECFFRVLLSECCVGFGAGYCCQSAVQLWNLGAGVAAGGGCEMSMAVWALGPGRDYVYAVL